MAVKKSQTMNLEQRKKIAAEELWLQYYNQTLFERGMITELERNLMISKINARTTRCLAK